MLHTTDAIVLSLQPHSDKAHVLHAYTRDGGRVNYRVYGIGRKNAAGVYNPLSLIQITADDYSIRSAQLNYVSTTTTTNPHKQAIALFLGEVLYHTLRHPMPDEPMFEFIAEAVKALDTTSEPQNFHLQFLIGFAEKLGFAMQDTLPLPRTRTERQEQLRRLCAYFDEHVETWSEPRSLDILMEVFD